MYKTLFPYREKYLEFIVSLDEDPEKYQTMLAELYVNNLFLI